VPLYLDHHELGAPVTFAEVAAAHQADLQEQAGHDVRYLRFWVDEARGRVFCLVEAPSIHAAQAVHLEAHGLVAAEVFEVQEGA
jgi:hypothetical protein